MAASIGEDADRDNEKYFQCKICGLQEKYKYFGKQPPFSDNYKFLEDVYLIKDPFSAASRSAFLMLGSNCSICDEAVCQAQECSLFFSKRFCIQCAKLNVSSFPSEIRQEISKQSEKLTSD